MAIDGRKDPKYQACIESTKQGNTPMEQQKENPKHPFLVLSKEFVTKKKSDSTGLWKNFSLTCS